MRSYTITPSIRRRWQPTLAAANSNPPQHLRTATDSERCAGVVPAVQTVLANDLQCPAESRTPETDEGATCMCPYSSAALREANYDQGEAGTAFAWVRPYGAPPCPPSNRAHAPSSRARVPLEPCAR